MGTTTSAESLVVVSGPSSVGKSTFLAGDASRRVLGEVRARDEPLGVAAAHYNILRPFSIAESHALWVSRALRLADRVREPKGRGRSWSWRRIQARWSYDSDARWRGMRDHDGPRSAVVLVSPLSTLVERVRTRTTLEPESERSAPRYPSEYWLRVYAAIDLVWVYEQWLAALDSSDIQYRIFESREDSFRPVLDRGELADVVKAGSPPP